MELVIEHVQAGELPLGWLKQLGQLGLKPDQAVTVRIEPEDGDFGVRASPTLPSASEDPAFGIWRDHDSTRDVEGYLRSLRAPRYNRDGSRNEL